MRRRYDDADSCCLRDVLVRNSVKGMSDERQNRPILSADKIARQKSVVCHTKIARFCRPR